MSENGTEPWIDWGGEGPALHFAHANGFPPRCYGPLLEPLKNDFRIYSWEARPLWSGSRPESIDSWTQMAGDLVGAMWSRGMRKVLGVGHSLGAVLSLIAAAREPDLFSAIVVIDPVILSGLRSRTWQMMKKTKQCNRLPLIRQTLGRVESWPNREVAKLSWSGKKVFRDWTASSFDAYAEHGLVDDSTGGVCLRYPKRWEARIFELAPHDVWPDIRRVNVPILGLRGETSDTFFAGAARQLVRQSPRARCEVVKDTGHFMPMENPEEVARLIRVFAAEAGVKTLSS